MSKEHPDFHTELFRQLMAAPSPFWQQFTPCPFQHCSHHQKENTMTTKLAVFDSPAKEPEKIYTLRLNQSRTAEYINLDVVDPKTGHRLMDGTLLRLYPNGKVTYRIMGGCKQGGITGGRMQEHQA